MNSHKVVSILEKPKRMTIGLGDVTVEYWSVLCKLETPYGSSYESSVTFDCIEDAIDLKIGDVFLR